MKICFWQRVVAAVTMTTLLNACGSIKDYALLSQAGQSYTQAIDKLLEATKKISIDSSSEAMLRDRANTVEERTRVYTQTRKTDTEWLSLLSKMQDHTDLLSQYFRRLQALATSDASERAQQETDHLITNLSKVGNEIRSNQFVTEHKVIPQIVNIAVKAHVRASLKTELQARQATIQKELDTQEEILILIKQELKRQLTELQNNQEQRLLYTPYVTEQKIVNPDGFVRERNRILSLTNTIPEIEQATQVSQELRSSFLDLLDGKLTLARVNVLVTDINSLLNVAQQVTPSKS